MKIQRMCIIGVGLIGGSLARAMKTAGACQEIVGCGRHPESLQKAIDLGVIDRFETRISAAVAGADLIVIATPLGAMAQVFRDLAEHSDQNTVITDVGSAKAGVVAAARESLSDEQLKNFVPGHPIAGIEKSGVEASLAELFKDHCSILSPLETTHKEALAKVRFMWEQCGAEVVEMNVEHHDEILAATSHLPHLLAYTLVDTLARMEEKSEIFKFGAGGFRDFTRIASSDPQMWHDICLENSDAILEMLDRYMGDLQLLSTAIRNQDSKTLLALFMRAKEARDTF